MTHTYDFFNGTGIFQGLDSQIKYEMEVATREVLFILDDHFNFSLIVIAAARSHSSFHGVHCAWLFHHHLPLHCICKTHPGHLCQFSLMQMIIQYLW
jgi:hypothetical protein